MSGSVRATDSMRYRHQSHCIAVAHPLVRVAVQEESSASVGLNGSDTSCDSIASLNEGFG